MTQSPTDPIVERIEAKHRYEIAVEGRRAGLTAYRDRGDQRVFYHTEVDDAFTGQGLAAALVHRALDDTRESSMRIVPVCPYVAKYLKRHTEYADIADPATPEILEWLERELA
ncbi:N-acetyltransferase [Glycomyces albus]